MQLKNNETKTPGSENNPPAENAKKFPLALLIIIGTLAVLIIVFSLITDEIVLEQDTAYDTYVYHLLEGLTSPTLTGIMSFVTFFGSSEFLLPAYVIIIGYYLIFKKSSKDSLGIAAVAISGIAILFFLKNFFKRQRPSSPLIAKVSSFSYPSGHSFSAYAFSGILIYLIWRTRLKTPLKWVLSIFLFLSATLVAFSRVYLHVHYASDVVAGFCLSLVWLMLCYLILAKFKLLR